MNFIILGIRTGLDDVNIFLKTYHSENVLCSVTVGGQESDKSVYSSSPPPAKNNFYRAWKSPKKVLMQKIQKFCANFEHVNLKFGLWGIFEKKSLFLNS